MLSINSIVFFVGILLLLGIASSKFSARIGMPVLVLFLGVGMLFGSEGLGGISFEDYRLANSIGSVALAMILFDGGLRTSLAAVRSSWKPALSLSTVGVFFTSLLTGFAASWILDLPLLHGMLLGSIVGSTDAAAVFSILRTSGLRLPERLTATLEVESGSNDPMAIFLTLGLIGLIMGTADSAAGIGLLFLLQFGVGSMVGLAVGLLAARVINRINLDYPGLYPILALSLGLLSFGLAAVLGGSGFLAIYLAGIALGNSSIVFRNGIFLFHDAGAWLGQMILFIMLGLLSFPSRLAAVSYDGLLIALVLIVVARPLAVLISIFPFRFRFKEIVFLGWVGLKGAVPITLATFPLLAGVQNSELIFNIVFFVVLVSAITQGWSLPLVARWLRLGRTSDPVTPLTVEINALRHVDGEIVEFVVTPSSKVAGLALRDIALPHDVVATLVVRKDQVIIPRGNTILEPGDHVFVAMRSRLKPLLTCLFDSCPVVPPLFPGFQLDFRADCTIKSVCQFFGLPEPEDSDEKSIGTLVTEGNRGIPTTIGPFVLSAGNDPDKVTLTYLQSNTQREAKWMN
ncbi:potassium/proton antiporter [Desulfofustis limnaeus]|uniref:K+/H+ antiporter n=1 Tax=Desulfofustis limnaeus TaxID=2740163 RepID=A0ABN6MBN0_9BACT|nr:potassium/proton antiporter [Desulfofustis limnaeus]BDD88769.1 K+/H+ antiporter [Desulfofustis limnaeus]